MIIKKWVLFFSGILFSVACQGQTTCNCMENYKFSNAVFVTNVTAIKKNGSTYLSFNCATFLRLYIRDEDGLEIEKTELDCISRKRNALKLNRDFEYYLPQDDETTISNKEIQKIFLHKIKSKSKLFFQLKIDEKKEIVHISDFFWTPE